MRLASALAATTLGWLLAVPVAAQQVTLEPSAAVACMTPVANVRGVPEYPFIAFKDGRKGRVKVVLSFTSPDTHPAVEVTERDGDDSFVDAVKAHVRQLRVPCHDGGERPVRLVFEFVFRPDDREVFGSGPSDADAAARKEQLACMDLLPTVRNIKLQRPDFDFNRMACPFDVAMTYYQPHRPNQVVEVGSHDAARQPFLDWLRQSQLNLPEPSLDSVFGDTARFTVPCLKIKLQPQEPS